MTSGVTSLALTARDVISFALRKLAVMPIGEELPENEIEAPLLNLNLMLKSWETTGPHLWRNTDGGIALANATPSYSLTADNPLRLVEVRYQYPDGHHLPLTRLTRKKYKDLPVKTSQGSPTQYYFDPQESGQTLFLWPVLSAVTTDMAVYTFQRRFQICQTLDDSIDIPQEWLRTVGYALADDLIPDYGVTGEHAQHITSNAAGRIKKAKGFDRPSYVQFKPAFQPGRR